MEHLLGPTGPVARSIGGYEERAEQVRMARAVDEALRAPRHLLVEAGTGSEMVVATLGAAGLAKFHRTSDAS